MLFRYIADAFKCFPNAFPMLFLCFPSLFLCFPLLFLCFSYAFPLPVDYEKLLVELESYNFSSLVITWLGPGEAHAKKGVTT